MQRRGRDFPSDEPTGLIQTEYNVSRNNFEGSVGWFGFDMHNPVVAVSATAAAAFVALTLAMPAQAASIFGWLF